MKNLLILWFCLSMLFGMAQHTSYTASKLWASPDILTTSESVCFYDDEKVIFTACINGNPTDKDGNGFISKLSLTGEVMLYKWAANLNAPKGMGITNGFLFVSDIDRVVKIDVKDGSIIKEFEIKEAQFLNDICIGDDEAVYISDMGASTIYRIHNDAIEKWLNSDLLEQPNGLNYEDGKLLVGTKQGIFSVDSDDKKIRHIVKNTGGIDGLEIFEDGYYMISDWSGKVQLVHPDRNNIVLLNTTEQGINAADINYVSDRSQLFIPTFMDNRVVCYDIIKE